MRISAVIAAHDAEPWLGEAIDSALRELPADSELVVVDDGSTDGTPDDPGLAPLPDQQERRLRA
ncbi:MAG: glycosyltransferase, partial [Deltaproteobacteria bacterium]